MFDKCHKYLLVLLMPVSILLGCGTQDFTFDDEQDEKTEVIEEASVEADVPEDKGVGGWWGIRHVKESFTDNEDDEVVIDENDEEVVVTQDPSAEVTPQGTAGWGNDDLAAGGGGDYEHALKLIREQNYSEARHLLSEVVEKNPSNSSAWRWLGDCEYNMQELAEAILAYEKALHLNHENYFAMRGLGFAHLHYGNEMWRAGKRKQAHAQYKKALKLLQACVRIYPADIEAMYGRSMAAEGASRRLYQSAITLYRRGSKQDAEAAANACIKVIDEGIGSARQRMYKNNDEVGPRTIVGGLFQRRGILLDTFGRTDAAVKSMEQAVKTYKSILQISPDNYLAKRELEKCDALVDKWQKKLAAEPML